MLRNKNLKFLCQHVHIRVENARTDFTRAARKGQVLRIPIAHFDGNYYAPPRVLRGLETNGQIVFRYCDADGNVTPEANVNGSLHNIAGIRNEAGNVLGLMPHPERASEPLLGSEDGRAIFESLILSLEKRRPAARPAARKKARHDR
jgi:phosphoribosylformylglycinamidine synthase I